MIRICFVCLGNICRSPMTEFIMKDLVNKKSLQDKFYIVSKATSDEELGNGIYPPVQAKLREKGIPFDEQKRVCCLVEDDRDKFDYIIGMEEYNVQRIERIIGKSSNVYRLLDFTNHPRNVADPWYTRNFEKAYEDILEGCEAFLNYLMAKEKISN